MMTTELNGFGELAEKMAALAEESAIYEKLAYYFEQNYMRIIFMTASEVAAKARVSQGSVSRFCSALGFRGYNDLLHNLQRIVSEEITAPQRLQFTSENSANKGKLRDIAGKEALNLAELENIIGSEPYERLINELVGSETVLLMSARMSATLLPHFAYILSKIRNSVYEVTPGTNMWENLVLRNPKKNVIVAVGFPRYPMALINKLRELKGRGFTIYAVTDSRLSPLCPIADVSFVVPITVSSIFDIYSTPMVFFNILCNDMAKRTEKLNLRLQALESYDEENKVYYKSR